MIIAILKVAYQQAEYQSKNLPIIIYGVTFWRGYWHYFTSWKLEKVFKILWHKYKYCTYIIVDIHD